MTTPKIQVTGFVKTAEGRYQMRINGVPHWTDLRGWGLYAAGVEIQVSKGGLRRKTRISKMLASPADFRLPADAHLASLVVAQDLMQLAAKRRSMRENASGTQVENLVAQAQEELVAA